MHSILDQLTTSEVDIIDITSVVGTSEKSSFGWSLLYNVYKDTDDSAFERRVIQLFAPFGDVVIKDYNEYLRKPEKYETDSNGQLYKKRILLFNRPRYFRTDVRLMIYFLIAMGRAKHPLDSELYLRKKYSAKYTTLKENELTKTTDIYDLYIDYPLRVSIMVALLLDETLLKKNKDKNGNIVTQEINRARQHYLNVIVV